MLLYNILAVFKNKNEKIPSFLAKKLNVSSKTLANILSKKHTPYDSTINTILNSIDYFIHNIDGLSYNRTLLEKYIKNTDYKNIQLHNIIDDKYFKYYYKQLTNIKKIENFISSKTDLYKNTTTIHDNYPFLRIIEKKIAKFINHKELPQKYIVKTIQIEFHFYLFAAHEAEYNYNFMGKEIENSLFKKYIPYLINNSLQHPFSLWIKFLIDSHGNGSIKEFSKKIYGTENPKLDDKIRTFKKWIEGQVIPSKKSIDAIITTLAKKYSNEKEDIAYLNEQGTYAYYKIKAFQIFLTELLPLESHQIDRERICIFFQDYLFWYKYHYRIIQKKAG